MGDEILERVVAKEGRVFLKDSINFAGDSLFCEWAYVLDLDTATFEVFKGAREEPAIGRFANAPMVDRPSIPDTTYYPVSLVRTWSLDDLPSNRAFLNAFPDSDDLPRQNMKTPDPLKKKLAALKRLAKSTTSKAEREAALRAAKLIEQKLAEAQAKAKEAFDQAGQNVAARAFAGHVKPSREAVEQAARVVFEEAKPVLVQTGKALVWAAAQETLRAVLGFPPKRAPGKAKRGRRR